MDRPNKRLAALALALALLTACGPQPQPPVSSDAAGPQAATAAPASEPAPAATPEGPLVADALRYEREVVEIGIDPTYDFGEHLLAIPRIDREGAGAQALNQKIWDRYAALYQQLQDHSEEDAIYRIDYVSRTAGDLVGIMITELVSWQYSEGTKSYAAFYYDAARDRELTFAEYLAALGLDRADLQARLLTMEDTGDQAYHTKLGDAPELTGCIADAEGTTVVFSHVYSEMNGDYNSVLCYSTGPVL